MYPNFDQHIETKHINVGMQVIDKHTKYKITAYIPLKCRIKNVIDRKNTNTTNSSRNMDREGYFSMEAPVAANKGSAHDPCMSQLLKKSSQDSFFIDTTVEEKSRPHINGR